MSYQRKLMKRQRELQTRAFQHQDVSRVQVFHEQTLSGSLATTWDKAQAAAVVERGFDTLEIELHLDCEDHLDSNCAAWDQLVNLYLCTPESSHRKGNFRERRTCSR